MSKAVLLSIKPQYCELIESCKKTVEVRKTKPKIEMPFKCYIYCTKDKHGWFDFLKKERLDGKVIGEFVCDKITMSLVGYDENGCPSYWDILDGSCLTSNELVCYGELKHLYGWHISDLIIYDKPKELYEFYRKCENMACEGCEHLKYQRVNAKEYDYDCEYFGYKIPITRPPQSWCYVEEID